MVDLVIFGYSQLRTNIEMSYWLIVYERIALLRIGDESMFEITRYVSGNTYCRGQHKNTKYWEPFKTII